MPSDFTTPKQSGTLQMSQAWADIAHDRYTSLIKLYRTNREREAYLAAREAMQFCLQFKSWQENPPDSDTRVKTRDEFQVFLEKARKILSAK